jgi:hypothetical protein
MASCAAVGNRRSGAGRGWRASRTPVRHYRGNVVKRLGRKAQITHEVSDVLWSRIAALFRRMGPKCAEQLDQLLAEALDVIGITLCVRTQTARFVSSVIERDAPLEWATELNQWIIEYHQWIKDHHQWVTRYGMQQSDLAPYEVALAELARRFSASRLIPPAPSSVSCSPNNMWLSSTVAHITERLDKCDYYRRMAGMVPSPPALL